MSRVQKLVVGFMNKAEWWLSECEKLSEVSESQKRKLINKLTNQSSTTVQPILKICNGTQEYLFTDDDICRELEDYHISKTQNIANCDLNTEKEIQNTVSELVRTAENDHSDAHISDYEVNCTFGKGSDTPGHDGISAKLIDNADREQMHQCLKFLWNTAWCKGHFISEWKKENRVVLPKPGKDCYNECSSYRTVSITPFVGKRFNISLRRD